MVKPTSDRNLLFGILALQKTYITDDAFVAAMNAWVQDKQKGLAQILREQNALTENHHALLEECVAEHLARNGNDPAQGLAHTDLVGAVRQALDEIADPEVRASLARVASEPAPLEIEEAPLLVTPIEPEAPAPRRKADAKRPTSAQPGGVAVWMWLVGGLFAGFTCAGVAAVIGVVFFFLLERPQPNPIAPENQLPIVKGPIENPAAPIIAPPPVAVAVAPPLSRKPTAVIGEAEWKVEGGELVVTNRLSQRAFLHFGSKEWTDYDLAFETNSAAQSSGTIALFRADDERNHYAFSLGAFVRAKHALSRVNKGGVTYDLPPVPATFNFDQWYKVRIEARGNQFRCYVDEKKIFDYTNNAHSQGQVALGATGGARARWKNIKVTAPDGKVLWDGLPDLSGTGAPPPVGTFVSLFNGKDLTGWNIHPKQPAAWRVENGILVGSGPISSYLCTTRDDFQDFHLRVEARINQDGLSGVYFRTPFKLADEEPAKITGYQALINSTSPLAHKTGTLMMIGKDVSSVQYRDSAPAPDEWFTMEMQAVGNRLTIKVNGKTTVDFRDARMQHRSGRIALRHDILDTVTAFRKIEILEIKPAELPPLAKAPRPDEGFVPLFNGKDLTGWKPRQQRPDTWRVENGILIGSSINGARGRLETERIQPKNFHLRLEARINEKGTGNVAFRVPQGSLFGYEATISAFTPFNTSAGGLLLQNPAGGGRGFPRIPDTLFRPEPGVWFTLELIVQDDRLVVKVDGKDRTDIVDATLSDAGHIALTAHTPAAIEFRKIEIKELPAGAALPAVAKGNALPPAPGFVALFNGKDLANWVPHRTFPGDWRVVDGVLTGSGPRTAYLQTARENFKNWHLRAEVRYAEGAAAGIGGILGRSSQPPFGYEAMINLSKKTGGASLASRKNGFKFVQGSPLPIAPGEWFQLEMIAEENRFKIKVNGVTTAEFVDDANEFPVGPIVLHQRAKGVLEFRRIEIKELPAGVVLPPAAKAMPPVFGFVTLFNGKDLAGWKTHPKQLGDWSVKDGILIGRGPAVSALYSDRGDYQDFHLRVEARINDGGVGGVSTRAAFGPAVPANLPNLPNGFFAAINSNGNFVSKTGSMKLFGAKTVSGNAVPPLPGEWFTMEVIAQGTTVKVVMKGRTTANIFDFDRIFPRGHIALASVSPLAQVEFRRIEIRELPPAFVPPPDLEPVLIAGEPVALFNGKDLTGWKTHPNQPGDWRVVDGVLIGRGPAVSSLYSERGDYKHFRLVIEARMNDGGLAALLARTPFGPLTPRLNPTAPIGFHAPIDFDEQSPNRTGSVSLKEPIGAITLGYKSKLAPGEWFILEIRATNNQASVMLNGKMLASVADQKRLFRTGHVGLFLEKPDTILEVRKIEISEMHPPGAMFTTPLAKTEIPGGADPAPTKHFAFTVPADNRGKWRIEGNELVQDSIKGPMSIFFGDPNWTDYDFSVDVKKTAGADQFALWFRRPDANRSFIFGAGAKRGTTHMAALIAAGLTKQQQPLLNAKEALEDGRWYHAKVSVRGDKAECYLDNAKLFEFRSDELPAGGVGLRTWFTAYRFKNIRVTAPNGAVLLEGLPEWMAAPKLMPPNVAKAGFVSLFNGKDLAGWQPYLKTAGNWRVDNGILTGAGGEPGVLHTVRADYRDYHLRLEARFTGLPDADASGVLFRSTFGRAGYETVFANGKYTGGLYLHGNDFGKPAPAKAAANVVSGAWFTLDLIANGPRVIVKVNDQDTVDFVDSEKLFTNGHIALSQGAGSKLEFRKIEIQEFKPGVANLPPINKAGPGAVAPPLGKGVAGEFTPLFNGKDLDGWQAHPKRPGNWHVADGLLTANAPGGGSLVSSRGDYQDFHVRLDARINDKGFGRIFVRAPYDPAKIPFKILGYEALINQRPVGAKTGTLTAASATNTSLTEAKQALTKPGEWFTMEIIARGDRVTVKVNGVETADFLDQQRKHAKVGHVVLQQDPNAVIEFRRIEIMNLARPD